MLDEPRGILYLRCIGSLPCEPAMRSARLKLLVSGHSIGRTARNQEALSQPGLHVDSNALPADDRTIEQTVARWSWKKFWLSLFIAVLVAVVAILGYMAYDDHYVQRGHFFLGTSIAGIDVSHKTPAWANAQVDARVAQPLLKPLTVTYRKRKWIMDTPAMARVDVKGMVSEAYRSGWNLPIYTRLYKRWMKEPLNVDVPVRFTFDRHKIGVFVKMLEKKTNRKAVDARQYVDGHKIKISPSSVGYWLYSRITFKRIAAALPAGERQMKLPVAVLPPKKTKKDFKHAIFINLSENMLYLYTYDKITASYGVATGMSSFPTPTGDWKIVDKRYNPTWHNPHMAWSAGMPESIGPGPGNPLGTRALDLNAPAIRIHGTYSDGSIGSHASHGCIRMHIWESEELYDKADVGTPVYIRW